MNSQEVSSESLSSNETSTENPTETPTKSPSLTPSASPTIFPTFSPTNSPTFSGDLIRFDELDLVENLCSSVESSVVSNQFAVCLTGSIQVLICDESGVLDSFPCSGGTECLCAEKGQIVSLELVSIQERQQLLCTGSPPSVDVCNQALTELSFPLEPSSLSILLEPVVVSLIDNVANIALDELLLCLGDDSSSEEAESQSNENFKSTCSNGMFSFLEV